jgi:3-methylcrotonyl-CoA carboxylase alpha subunit
MLDQNGDFYFLEMNTRLQVEHPVTEFVTGLDLVQLQLAVARGEALPFAQRDIILNGHAIEARIYAEDPVRMLPSVGHVAVFAPPDGPGVRNDVGLQSGDEVTVNYDPMLAKLIVHGEDREEAIARMQQALREYAVLGVATNIPLLQAIVNHEAFAAGDTTTDFLDTYRVADMMAQDHGMPDEVLCAAALVALLRTPTSDDPWARPWRIGGSARRLAFEHENQTSVVQATARGTTAWMLRIGERAFDVTGVVQNDTLLTFTLDGEQLRLYVARDGDTLLLAWHGRSYRVAREAPLSVELLGNAQHASSGHTSLQAPMPGTIIKVLVQQGDAVDAHAPLVVMEAMKMEHTVVAPYAGVVSAVPFAAGQLVSGGATLIELDAA